MNEVGMETSHLSEFGLTWNECEFPGVVRHQVSIYVVETGGVLVLSCHLSPSRCRT